MAVRVPMPWGASVPVLRAKYISNVVSLQFKHLFSAHPVHGPVLILFGHSFKFELCAALGVAWQLIQDARDVEVFVVLFPVLTQDLLVFLRPFAFSQLDELVVARMAGLLHLLTDLLPVGLVPNLSKLEKLLLLLL